MIETERLILREWQDSDRDAFVAMCNSPAVMEHLGGPATSDEVDAAIARIRACQAQHGHCFWAVERKQDSGFLGFCGLRVAPDKGTPVDDCIEIGWRLREDAWGQGYAREAAEASLAWAWRNLGASQVVALTVVGNRRSWGLMERLGMARRPDLDYGDPTLPADHPLHNIIVYAAYPPARAE